MNNTYLQTFHGGIKKEEGQMNEEKNIKKVKQQTFRDQIIE